MASYSAALRTVASVVTNEEEMSIVKMLGVTTQSTELDALAKSLVAIYAEANKLLDITKLVLKGEIDKTDRPQQLFRTNSLASKMLTESFRQVGKDWIVRQSSAIQGIIAVESGLEVDPAKLPPGSDIVDSENTTESRSLLDLNLLRLETVLQTLVDSLFSSYGFAPMFICSVLKFIETTVLSRFETGGVYEALGGVLFLRFICPAIISPESFGLVDENVRVAPEARRGLVLVTKVLQALANGVQFRTKESYMIPLNPFIERNRNKLETFFKQLTAKLSDEHLANAEATAVIDCNNEHLEGLHEILTVSLASIEKRVDSLTCKALCSALFTAGGPPRARASITRSKIHARFSLMSNESLSIEAKCTEKGKIDLHGTLYVTQSRFFFYSKVFGLTTREVIPHGDIESMEMTMDPPRLTVSGMGKKLSFGRFASERVVRDVHAIMRYFKVIQSHRRPQSSTMSAVAATSTSLLTPISVASAPPISSGLKVRTPTRMVSADPAQQHLDNIMTENDWSILMEGAVLTEYNEDQTVLEEGVYSNSLFQVGRGVVRVEKSTPERTVLARLTEGEMFGEMSFLDGAVTSAGIVADEPDVEVYVMPGAYVSSLVEVDPTLPGRMYRYLATMLAFRLRSRLQTASGHVSTPSTTPPKTGTRLRSLTRSRSALGKAAAKVPPPSTPTPPPNWASDVGASVISHRTRARDDGYRQSFKLTEADTILVEWPCAMMSKMPVYGNLVLTTTHMGFFGKVIGFKTVVSHPFTSITSIKKRSQGIEVTFDGSAPLLLSNFSGIDHVYSLIKAVRKSNDVQTTVTNAAASVPLDLASVFRVRSEGETKGMTRSSSSGKLDKTPTARLAATISATELGKNEMDAAEGMMDEKEWQLFFDGAKLVTYKLNESIMVEGQPCNSCFQIAHGECRVESLLGDKPHVLSVLTDGDTFGDITFVTGAEAVSTIVANQDNTQVYEFTQRWVDQLLVTHPRLPGLFYKFWAMRLGQRIRDMPKPPCTLTAYTVAIVVE